MGNTFGTLFRVTTWGESHGGGVGAVVDGCPPRLPLSETDIQPQLDRRRPGQSRLTTPRQESDTVRILSGVFEGRTLGTPILLMVPNEDARPGAYESFRDLYRPSHADFTYDAKYGIRTWQGGGRSSARETVGHVAAGAIAEKILRLGAGIEITAWVRRIGAIEAAPAELECLGSAVRDADPAAQRLQTLQAQQSLPSSLSLQSLPPLQSLQLSQMAQARQGSRFHPLRLTREMIDATPVRCPDLDAAALMIAAIEDARREGDSLGGVIECVARGVPAGLGEPVFGKLEAELARAVMSIPACTGFELGTGFGGTRYRGSEHNDAFRPLPATDQGSGGATDLAPDVDSAGLAPGAYPGGVAPGAHANGLSRRIGTATNRSGGVQGGISNGEAIWFRAAFKPTATIQLAQETVDREGRAHTLEAQGRHDPCVLPRAVPIIESMTALVLCDHWLRQLAIGEAAERIERAPRNR
jgi:chorismate synthase